MRLGRQVREYGGQAELWAGPRTLVTQALLTPSFLANSALFPACPESSIARNRALLGIASPVPAMSLSGLLEALRSGTNARWRGHSYSHAARDGHFWQNPVRSRNPSAVSDPQVLPSELFGNGRQSAENVTTAGQQRGGTVGSRPRVARERACGRLYGLRPSPTPPCASTT